VKKIDTYTVLYPQEYTYEEYIHCILQIRDNTKSKDFYQEKHHIIPRTMGGDDSPDNLIWLFPEEHYFAHKLLAEENPHNGGLQYAWWMMANKTRNQKIQRDYFVEAKDYAKIKQRISILMGNRMRGVPKTESFKKQMSERFSGENNPNYGKTGELSPTYGVQRFGKDNPFFGHRHSIETKKKIGERNKGKLSEYNNPSSKAVICIETNECFLTVREAAFWCNTNLYGSNIIKSCKDPDHKKGCGKHPQTGDSLHWRYATSEERENKINSLMNP